LLDDNAKLVPGKLINRTEIIFTILDEKNPLVKGQPHAQLDTKDSFSNLKSASTSGGLFGTRC